MAYTPQADTAAITAVKAAATWISLHTADPGSTNTAASEVSGGAYARMQTTWGTVTSGSVTGSAVVINVPAGTTITHWALHANSSGASDSYFGGALAASEVFGSAGTYSLTATLTAT